MISSRNSEYIPKGNEKGISKSYMYSYIYCSIFTIANKWKQPKYLTLDEWIKTHIHAQGGILFSHEKEDMLSFVPTWLDLESIMLSEERWIKKKQI